MLAIFATVALVSSPRVDSVTLPVKESAWVYVHAGDPTGDAFLRVWGAEGMAAPDNGGGAEDFSFGFLKLDVSALPAAKPKKAVLVVYCSAPPTFEEDDLKQTPLQARELTGSFSAADWGANTASPGTAKTVFGTGKLAGTLDKSKPIEIDVDLLKGPSDFSAFLSAAEAGKEHALYLALTSAIQPNSQSGSFTGMYKLYSVNAKEKELRPVLKLEF